MIIVHPTGDHLYDKTGFAGLSAKCPIDTDREASYVHKL